MTPERWQHIERLYHEALARAASERRAFLASACGGDEMLQREVESLLAQPVSTDGSLDGPAPAVAATFVSDGPPAVSPGTWIGVYEVRGLLGKGGMGEVYRARDTRLGRDVAIKILPAAFTRDPDRLARFEREARVLASLNHPNIATIYGVEEGGDVRALVMELVKGTPLAARSVSDALALGRQIAEALEAAHEKGIVHRDLKPANILVTKDGAVKVLDFGLARDSGTASAGQASEPLTIAVTREGTILGTAAYMSPEQARGLPLDTRSDIWAFGCVLYELLTGRQAFGRATVTDTLSAVVDGKPDWRVLPERTPPVVRRLLARCLEKNVRRRLQHIGDARLDLEEALDGRDSTFNGIAPAPTTGVPLLSRRRSRVLSGAALLGVAMVAIGASWWRPVGPERSVAFSIVPPDGTSFASTILGGASTLSPDGRTIAFVAEGSTGRSLWVRPIDSFDARQLPATESAIGPFWSPDGNWLGFVTADGNLKKVNVMGGQPQTLARAQVSGLGATTGAWNSEGAILFYGPGNTLFSVPASGGDTVPVSRRNVELFDENHFAPAFLRDGRHYLVLVRGGAELEFQLCVGQMGSDERTVLLRSVTNAQYAPPRAGRPGHLLFVRDGTLMAQPFDDERLELSGSPVRLVEGITVTGGGALADFSVSPAGVLAYRRSEPQRHELVWYDRSGKQVGAIGDRPGNPRSNVRLSPDGNAAAFTRFGNDTQDVWIADLIGGGVSRFTLNGGRTPIWSPDGLQIAYVRQDTIYIRKSLRGGEEIPVWQGPGLLSVNDWSGDGRHLLLTLWDTKAGAGGRGIWLLAEPLAAPAARDPLFLELGVHPQFVPAIGRPRWVSYDAGDVFVRTMPGDTPGKWQVSTDGGNGSRWTRDGREVYFSNRGYRSLVAATVDPASSIQSAPIRPLFTLPRPIAVAIGQYGLGYDVSADGERFLATFPSSEDPAPTITIVTNWQSLLP